MRIALVAGETSGDTLGAALIEALRRRFPKAEFAGVAGPKMRAAGCTAWHDIDELAVMGLTEVITHLPRLMSLRARLRKQILEWRPDVFVGVDYKEFNLGLARQLKRAGLATVQYVSPQVWAWRQGRVRTIGESVDLVLCLFPFEPDFYREHGVRAAFVGHPLADQIPLEVDRAAARAELGLHADARVLAVLPGSRRGEVEKLADVFAGAAELLAARVPGLVSIAPMVTPALRDLFAARCAQVAPNAGVRMLDGQARRALAAADVVLVASGTATLETALFRRPMVVAYKLGFITAFLLRTLGMVKIQHFSQPNLLAGKELVPEFFQEAASAANLANALSHWLEHPDDVARVQREFATIHTRLRCDGAERAAAEIGALVEARGGAAMKLRVRLRAAGVDEAGRGPLAGPVVAAAVILNPSRPIRGLADSKALEPEERERLALLIRERALCYSVAWADAEEIDSINILQATMLAMRRALLGLAVSPQQVFVDGNRCPCADGLGFECLFEAVIRGDAKVPSISAASILAKTTRDALMRDLDHRYPGFSLSGHKGYPTPSHVAALNALGPSPLHRRSFAPVRERGFLEDAEIY